MQTFLPYQSFEESASVLDNKRLCKQRIEALEILIILLRIKPVWMSNKWHKRCLSHKNHPCVRMWRGYENALNLYLQAITKEWIDRGFKNNLYEITTKGDIIYPWWLGDRLFHDSHKSNLLRKNKAWYSQYFKLPDNLPYIWPS